MASPTSSVVVRICQDDRCATATSNLGAEELGFRVDSFDGLAIDTTEPATAHVTVTRGGKELASARESFEFEDWHPDGPGCGTWKRHVVVVDEAGA